MAEYGNAIAVPTIGMTAEVDPEVMENAHLTLAFNYARAQQAHPELLGHAYKILDGPVLEVFESYEEDPLTGDRVGVGPIIGFTKQIGWYVNTEADRAAH